MAPKLPIYALNRYVHFFKRKVQPSDLNYMSHLDQSSLLKILHDARVDCLNNFGITERNLLPEKKGFVFMSIGDLTAQYLNPGELYDDLIIETGFSDRSRSGFRICHRIRSLVPIGSSDYSVSTKNNDQQQQQQQPQHPHHSYMFYQGEGMRHQHDHLDQPTGSTFKNIALLELGVVALDSVTKKPVGIGGGGGNSINHMIESELGGVDFFSFNTDNQDLLKSKAANTLQLGPQLTKGHGAGAKPDIGKRAAEESREQIKETLKDFDLIFLSASMGGGTGTGASPIIAKIIKEDIKKSTIVVAVVTLPFKFEGKRKELIAIQGLEELSKHVDTLVVISNESLLANSNFFTKNEESISIQEGFSLVNQVLHTSVKSITNIINVPGLINLNYSDLVNILSNRKGHSRFGSGEAYGEDRAYKAAFDAVNNPLIEKLDRYTSLLVNITGGKDITLKEVNRVATFVQENADPDSQIFIGHCLDESSPGLLRVSVLFVQ
eukprot:gene2617-3242_t